MTWYNNSYLHKKQIVIDHTKVIGGANLPSFPLLVSEPADSDLRTVSNGGKVYNINGYDIIFVDSTETTLLNFELDHYNPITGEIEAHVSIASLSYTADTTIYMYYGNSSIVSSQANPNATWDSSFGGVWHLSEASGNQNDSTSNANHLTSFASNITQGFSAGKIGPADLFAPGAVGYAAASSSSSLIPANSMTIELWVYILNLASSSTGRFIFKDADQFAYEFFQDIGPASFGFSWNNASNTTYTIHSNTSPSASNWYYIVGVHDASSNQLHIYINGVLDDASTVNTTGTLYIANPALFYVGSGNPPKTPSAIIDEVRLSSANRGAGWIATSYNNQSSPSTFMTIFPDQSVNLIASQYLFGAYRLNQFSNGYGNILRSKPVGAPAISPVVSTVARRYGAVKSGETVPVRDMPVVIKVVASSRSDLNVRLDALKKALWLRGQQLVIHEDSRYFANVDCVAADAALSGAANIAMAVVSMTFRTYDVMAYAAASSSYDTGTVVLTLASGVYSFPAIVIAGGGTVESYPLIHIINKTSGSHQWSAISVTQTTDSQTITTYSTAGVPLPANVNDYVDIQCDPSTGMSIITNGSGLHSDPVGVFPVLNPDNTTFNISITSPSAVSAEAVFSWVPRYL